MILVFSFAAARGAAQTTHARVNAASENLRESPNGRRLGQLLQNAEVLILETQGDWVKISTTGWMWKKSLTQGTAADTKHYIRASHILVSTESAAAEILSRLKAGEDFSALSQQYSLDAASRNSGGDLGPFARGDLMEAFENAAFQLKPGEISGIVKTNLGYHIIKRTK